VPREETDEALQAYLHALAALPRLTADEERALGARIQSAGPGCEDALRHLVEGNLRFVVSYAKRYRGLGVPFLDLIHEGNLGLMEAARRFDPDRNVKFITYAVWWIRQSITHALSGQTRAVTIPDKLSAVLHRLGATDISLNEHVGNAERGADGPEIGDLMEQGSVPAVEEDLIHRAALVRVRAALDELEDKEREVVTLRFGLDRDGEPRTLQEIGELLDLSRERIRQIESRAKEKLRKSKRAGELRSYLN
jgi:RNA polymerase primary sigma factor